MTAPAHDFDADIIVVGAGPAGSCAAIAAAREGKSVILVERGPFPGSKNMYGGVVYPRILDELIPSWWETMPVQRWVVKRSTMLLSDTGALNVDFRANAWGAPPYNGATAYRPDFDNWLANHAVAAGARLVCSTTVTGLLRDSHGRIEGVSTDRPDGDLRAPIVIACDGVNSFLAKESGLYPHTDASNFTLGVKETLALPKHVIDERFGVRDNQGVDIEILGGTSGVNGGGFIYTNLDTVALGVVLKLPKLAAQQKRPEQIIAELKRHPAVAPLIEGAEVKEYSAHVIPEAGLEMMPTMVADGMLVAGDAAALCLAAGIWLGGRQLRHGQRHVRRAGRRRGDHQERRVLARFVGLHRPTREDVRVARPQEAAQGSASRAVGSRSTQVPGVRRRRRRAGVPRRQSAPEARRPPHRARGAQESRHRATGSVA